VLSRTPGSAEPTWALAAPHPGRPPGWLTRASSPAGGEVWHPIDLPEGYHPVPRGQAWQARPTVGEDVAPGAPGGRAAPGRGDATQSRHARSVIVAERPVEKHLTQNQMFGSPQTARQSPRPENVLIYISSYINGYGRPRTPLDVNPKMRHVHGQFAGSGGVLLCDYGTEGFRRLCPTRASCPRVAWRSWSHI
jgi:hypothetical protein